MAVLRASVLTPLGARGPVSMSDVAFMSITPGREGDSGLGNLPVPDTFDGRLQITHPPQARLVRQFRGGRGLMLLDDLVWTPPQMQAGLLDAAQHRMIGDHFLGGGVRMMAATNDVAQGGWPLPPAYRNRVATLRVPPIPPDIYGAWLLSLDENYMGAGGDACLWGIPLLLVGPPGGSKTAMLWALAAELFGPDERWRVEEARVREAWTPAWRKAAILVAAFVKANPTMLQDPPNDPEAMSWPSPRSVELATRAWATATVHGLSGLERHVLVAGCAGPGFANTLETYAAHADLPDPEDVLDERVAFEHRPARLDRTFAVMAACGAVLAREACRDRHARSLAFVRLGRALLSTAPELLRPALVAMKATEAGMRTLGTAECVDLIRALEPIV